MFENNEPRTNNVAALGAPNTNGRTSSGKPKADAFLNVSFPTEDGGARKLGFFTFSAANGEEDQQLIEFLANATPEQMETFRSKLVLDFRMARTAPRKLAFS